MSGEEVEGGRKLPGGVLRVEVRVAWRVVGDFLRGSEIDGLEREGVDLPS